MQGIIVPFFIYIFTSAAFITLGLIFTLTYRHEKLVSTNKLFGIFALSGGLYYLLFGLYTGLEGPSLLRTVSFAFSAIYFGILPWFIAYYLKYIIKRILFSLTSLVLLSYALFLLYADVPQQIFHHVFVPTQFGIYTYGVIGAIKMYRTSKRSIIFPFLLANLIGVLTSIIYGIDLYFHNSTLIWIYDIFPIFFIGIISVRMILFNVKSIKAKNILQAKELENQQLLELNRIKSNSFSNISHEFRTSLTLILNPLKSVLPKIEKPELKQEVDLVLRNANKLLQLVNQILDLSKLEAGKMKKTATVGDLAKFIKINNASFDSLAKNLNIDYQKQYEVSSLITDFSKDHLEKIINNLLSNAIKFTPKSGKVKFSFQLITKNREGYSLEKNKIEQIIAYKITVADTGKGIHKEDLSKIFDRFYQVDSAANRNFEGTGIGLSLVKELIDLHKGTIKIKSEIGWGTEVVVELPIDKVYAVNNETEILEPNQFKNLQSANTIPIIDDSIKSSDINNKNLILIVEDNEDLRNYIFNIVKTDCEVLTASNGVEGLEIALNQIPDLIISDVMMPEMDGFELAKKLKTDNRTSHIPIILLTALSSKENKLSGLKIGVDEYLAKPFDEQELKIRIHNLIQIRANLQKHYISENDSSTTISLPAKESIFIKKSRKIIEENMGNDQFSVEDLSSELGMSRVQYHRKIKALTNHSTTHFIRTIRLEKAKELLQEGNYNITEVAYMVGFSSQSYFTKSFLKHFKISPSSLVKKPFY